MLDTMRDVMRTMRTDTRHSPLACAEDLRRDDYLVTWKADGVRYILVATVFGVFLLNRANQVRRIQVRIPWIPGRSPKDTAPCKLSDFEQARLW